MRGSRLLRAADAEAVAWRNGGGTTRRLLTSADDGGEAAAPQWTLSLADLTGPAVFSSFPGVDRTLLFLGEGSLELRVDGTLHSIGSRHQVTFAGEATVELTAGRGRALNLMTSRGLVKGRLTRSPDSAEPLLPRSPGADGPVALVVLEEHDGYCTGDTVLLAGHDFEVLETGLLDVGEGPGDLSVEAAGVHLRRHSAHRVG